MGRRLFVKSNISTRTVIRIIDRSIEALTKQRGKCVLRPPFLPDEAIQGDPPSRWGRHLRDTCHLPTDTAIP